MSLDAWIFTLGPSDSGRSARLDMAVRSDDVV